MLEPEKLLSGRVRLYCGDSRDVLRALPAGSIHAVVCDPPYALVSIRQRLGKPGAAPIKHGRDGAYARAAAGFMGKTWDTGETAFSVDFWREVFRVLAPGGHVVAFGGPRAFHRLTCAIEDAGFEIRDMLLELAALDPIVGAFVGSLDDAQLSAFLRVADLLGMEGVLAWVYGSGFPKSHDVGDGLRGRGADDAAARFEGWGTALKPAWEPICLARKPLAGTVAANVQAHGAGGLNVDGCRVGDEALRAQAAGQAQLGAFERSEMVTPERVGRFPANVVLDDSAEVAAAFPATASGKPGVIGTGRNDGAAYGAESRSPGTPSTGYGDAGSASRFFFILRRPMPMTGLAPSTRPSSRWTSCAGCAGW